MSNTVLVVGAAGGIGMEVTRQLVARGDKVIATVLDEAQAAQLAGDVPGVAQTVLLRLDDADAALEQVRALVAGLERLDQVVVCAAIGTIGPAELTTLASYRRTLEINTLSGIAVFQATLDALRASKGRLLFITSMSGKIAMPFLAAYTASKYALEGAADVMRQEIAGTGVKVIMVEPGGVRTPMVSDQIALTKKMESGLMPDQAARYGTVYKGFAAAAQAGYDGQGGGSTPDQVAAVILGALDADDPDTRYIAGQDAQQLLGARAAMGDKEVDAMLAGFFGG
ncbi:SDR family NAD(P)-dependent oxidoreductase [Novosphingobium lentum]|uniref:SDR family NAD(P)-dependent oxidoreductase n=1 Tax=Novosphingobium lentum TaxID=145287 RepID=UPI00082A172A|nr:SDR family NAD(P)-dependent oxidoreductase [Novosphingobium lentum]